MTISIVKKIATKNEYCEESQKEFIESMLINEDLLVGVHRDGESIPGKDIYIWSNCSIYQDKIYI